jgi:hypothetical protein
MQRALRCERVACYGQSATLAGGASTRLADASKLSLPATPLYFLNAGVQSFPPGWWTTIQENVCEAAKSSSPSFCLYSPNSENGSAC